MFIALAAVLSMVACKKDNVDKDDPTNRPGSGDSEMVHRFSVATGRYVQVAESNLQYQASTNQWRFAPNAWDTIGYDNLSGDAYYDGWIDCFCWGASGYEGQMPYSNSLNYEYFHDGDIAGTDYDWGEYNTIANHNHPDAAGTWRTMTKDEWDYLVGTRSTSTVAGVANARYVMATVNGVAGVILFPDQFVMPEGVNFMSAEQINQPAAYSYNQFAASEWEKMAKNGCVFLPAAGCKLAAYNQMISVGYLCVYWTASLGTYESTIGFTAYQQQFSPYMAETGVVGIHYARPVRLVKDVQ